MQKPYRTVLFEDIERLVAWCRDHVTKTGGIFEVYYDPAGINRIMVVVNSLKEQHNVRILQPVGVFYCNYVAPGVISLDEDPEEDGLASRFDAIKKVKQIIDQLLREARPGAEIDLSSCYEQG